MTQQTSTAINDRFAAIAEHYDAALRTHPELLYETDAIILGNAITRALKRDKRRVLELEFRTGNMSSWLDDFFYLVSTESSASLIEITRRKYEGMDFVHQDVRELDLIPNLPKEEPEKPTKEESLVLEKRFDAAVTYQSLFTFSVEDGKTYVESHLQDRGEISLALSNIANHLVPGGLFFISTREERSIEDADLGNGLHYRASIRQVGDEAREISHIVLKEGKEVARSFITRQVIPLTDFEAVATTAGFGNYDLTTTEHFYSMQKQN